MSCVVEKRRQPRPKWPHRKVTKAWQERVERELEFRDMSRSDLAKLVGVTPAGITGLLKNGTASSRLVDRVCEVLGVPGPEFRSDREFAFLSDIRAIEDNDPEEYELIRSRVRRIAADKTERKP